MPRPKCKLHPKSRVVRSGYYGAHNEFVRWLCKPGDGTRHYLNHDQRKPIDGAFVAHQSRPDVGIAELLEHLPALVTVRRELGQVGRL
jgi:hypothetical protein